MPRVNVNVKKVCAVCSNEFVGYYTAKTCSKECAKDSTLTEDEFVLTFESGSV